MHTLFYPSINSTTGYGSSKENFKSLKDIHYNIVCKNNKMSIHKIIKK